MLDGFLFIAMGCIGYFALQISDETKPYYFLGRYLSFVFLAIGVFIVIISLFF